MQSSNSRPTSYTGQSRDINSLLEDMISTNSQCTVHAAPMPSAVLPPLEVDTPLSDPILEVDTAVPEPTIEADEDEGFSELNDAQALDLLIRQEEQEHKERLATSLSSAASPSGVRKFGAGRHPLSNRLGYEYHRAGANSKTRPNEAAENAKVRCRPRMRKRSGQETVRGEMI